MEIQLTRTKTITIGGGGGGAKKAKRRAVRDVVGLDLFSSATTRGVPAVRLTEKKGVLHLTALGFVPPPSAALPASWEEASKACAWSLPAPFQAPHAAIAVTSPDMFIAQTTREAFKTDFAAGAHHGESDPAAASAGPKVKKFGIRRDNTPRMAPPQAAQNPSPAPKAASAAPLPDPEPGVPVSNGGTRFVMKPLTDSDDFVLEAGMPEYQVLWLSRLLPEGKRPTAASIQPSPSALAASVVRQPSFAAQGASLALFLEDSGARIIGYRDGDVVLWRDCRRAPGWLRIRTALKKGLGLDDEAVVSVLEDTLIDPRPALEPAIAPLLDELAVSRDYLVGKLGLDVKSAMVMGLPAGGGYWSRISEDRIRLPLVAPSPFDGIERAEKAHVDDGADGAANAFLVALGAALAYLGEEGD